MKKGTFEYINGKLQQVAVGSGLAVLSASSFAAVDPAVTTAISTGVADGATIGGLILAFVIGIAVFRHLRAAK